MEVKKRKVKIIKKTVTEQVIEIILEWIEKGVYKVGDQLPSQDILAKELDVSRVSVREALIQLQSRGMLDIRQGEGTFLTNKNINSSNFENLISDISIKDGSIVHILEVRKIIEQHTVELVIKRGQESHMSQLLEIINEVESLTDARDFLNKDMEFHLQIARISGNPILYRMLETIWYNFWDELLSVMRVPGMVEALRTDHRKIYDAIKAGDKKKAIEHMLVHLKAPEKLILKKISR